MEPSPLNRFVCFGHLASTFASSFFCEAELYLARGALVGRSTAFRLGRVSSSPELGFNTQIFDKSHVHMLFIGYRASAHVPEEEASCWQASTYIRTLKVSKVRRVVAADNDYDHYIRSQTSCTYLGTPKFYCELTLEYRRRVEKRLPPPPHLLPAASPTHPRVSFSSLLHDLQHVICAYTSIGCRALLIGPRTPTYGVHTCKAGFSLV